MSLFKIKKKDSGFKKKKKNYQAEEFRFAI